jgi:ASPIC/UnbV protein
VDRIEIIWPGGKHQTLENVKADRVLAVRGPE